MKVAAWIGLAGILLVLYTGDGSAYWAGKKQPMKLAAMEGVYEGSEGRGLIAVGVLNPEKKKTYDTDDVEPFLFKIEIPKLLSILATRHVDGFVPGIENIIEGGYTEGESKRRGSRSPIGRGSYRARKTGNTGIGRITSKPVRRAMSKPPMRRGLVLEENFPHFGDRLRNRLVAACTLCAAGILFVSHHGAFGNVFSFAFLSLFSSFLIVKALLLTHGCCGYSCFRCRLGYICLESGWVVAEMGRQPWVIQDIYAHVCGSVAYRDGRCTDYFLAFCRYLHRAARCRDRDHVETNQNRI